MSELGDLFKGHKQRSQQKRESNRLSSAELLTKYGVEFEPKNDGIHLIVFNGDSFIDFWPGTGKWICRDVNKAGRGVFRLLDYLGVDYKTEQEDRR